MLELFIGHTDWWMIYGIVTCKTLDVCYRGVEKCAIQHLIVGLEMHLLF